jgi:hypothetical protein
MAVPYGFKSWQHYVDKHIAECGACADYYQGDGQMSFEGKETDVSWLALELGLPDRMSKRLIENARCDGRPGARRTSARRLDRRVGLSTSAGDRSESPVTR